MADTPKGRATRARILDAAWDLSDARGAEVILGGVTLREIAAAVDMTPSAITYHFPTMRSLAVAMVEHLADGVSLIPLEAVDQLLARASEGGLAAMVRLAAQTNWDLLTEQSEVDFERRLTRCYAATGDNPDRAEIQRLIGSMTSSWIGFIAMTYRRTAEELGLQPVEPFTFDDLARGAAAVSEGLLYHWMCSPSEVRHDLAADLLVAMVSALVVPAPRSVDLAEVSAELPRPSATTHDDTAADLRLAELAAPLFGAGVDSVSLTEAGRLLEIDPQETATRFGSVSVLAALSFGRHLPTVRDAVERRRDVGPAVSLTDGVYELGRCVLSDRHCALALLHERQRTAAGGTSGRHDVRAAVPIGPSLAEPLQQLLDASDGEAVDLADLVVDHVLGHGATRPRTPVMTLTASALRLVPHDF